MASKKGQEIGIDLDASDLAAATDEGLTKPLEAARETLRQTGTDAEQSGRQIAAGTEAAAEAVDDAADSLQGVSAALSDVGRSSDALSRPVQKATADIEADLRTVADEAKQNAAEMFSSFDGSASSLADAVQGTLGGLVSGLGGLPGIALAAAGAAGLGAVAQAIEAHERAAEAMRDGITAQYRAAAEEGRDFLLRQQVDALALEITSDAARRAQAVVDASRIGVNENSYIRALAGDVRALDDALAAARRAAAEAIESVNSARGGEAYSPQVQTLLRIVSDLEGVQEMHEENQMAARLYFEISAEIARSAIDETRRVQSVEQSRWDERAAAVEAARERPVTIATQYATADAESLRLAIQQSADRKPVKLRPDQVTRGGKQIV